MIEIIISILIGIAIGVIFTFLYFRAEFKEWKIEHEKMIREDSKKKSRASLKGKIAEHLAPFFKEFKYDPSDARFIGNPIDYIIFDGCTDVKDNKEDKPITIVLVEVKTGGSSLTPVERRIKQSADKKLVKFEVIRIEED